MNELRELKRYDGEIRYKYNPANVIEWDGYICYNPNNQRVGAVTKGGVWIYTLYSQNTPDHASNLICKRLGLDTDESRLTTRQLEAIFAIFPPPKRTAVQNLFHLTHDDLLFLEFYRVGTKFHLGYIPNESLCGISISASNDDLHPVIERTPLPLDYICLKCLARERDRR